MGSFEQDLITGREGERQLYVMLRHEHDTVDVIDVTGDSVWQARDVDFIWRTSSYEYLIESKAENRYTGNFFIETISNCRTGRPGWLYTSHADYIAYGFLDRGKWFILPLQLLGDFLKTRSGFQTRHAFTSGPDGTKYETEGLIVPVTNADLSAIFVRTPDAALRDPSTFKPREDCVTHRNRPKWGLGRLVRMEGDRVYFLFEGRQSEVPISVTAAVENELLACVNGNCWKP